MDNAPEAIGYQLASRLEAHSRRLSAAPMATRDCGNSNRAPYTGEPSAAGQPHDGGGHSNSSVAAPGAGEAGPSRAPCPTWGPAHEYPFDTPHHEQKWYRWYARGDTLPSPDMA